MQSLFESKLPKMKIEPYHRREIKYLAQHEVGHYIVARVLGFKTGNISLEILDFNGGHKGMAEIILFAELSNIDNIIKYLENRIIVLYAGALSQTLNNGKINEDEANDLLLNKGSQNDFAKIRELIHVLRGIKYPKTVIDVQANNELDEIANNLWTKTIKIVEDEKELITGLASIFESDIKYTEQNIIITEKELDNIPYIKKRFDLIL
ncbi:MAG: peptidase M41 [Epsilonproteobacteria bacterium]|nr:MAG: peptidase M41 [Campylobacterota bacterium]